MEKEFIPDINEIIFLIVERYQKGLLLISKRYGISQAVIIHVLKEAIQNQQINAESTFDQIFHLLSAERGRGKSHASKPNSLPIQLADRHAKKGYCRPRRPLNKACMKRNLLKWGQQFLDDNKVKQGFYNGNIVQEG